MAQLRAHVPHDVNIVEEQRGRLRARGDPALGVRVVRERCLRARDVAELEEEVRDEDGLKSGEVCA